MTEFFDFFVSMFQQLFSLLGSVRFVLYGYEVTWLSVVFVFLVIGFVVGVFWKGARG